MEYSNIVKIIEPPRLDFTDSEERQRILNFLHEKIPLTQKIDQDSLLDAMQLSPMVIDRIQGENFESNEA